MITTDSLLRPRRPLFFGPGSRIKVPGNSFLHLLIKNHFSRDGWHNLQRAQIHGEENSGGGQRAGTDTNRHSLHRVDRSHAYSQRLPRVQRRLLSKNGVFLPNWRLHQGEFLISILFLLWVPLASKWLIEFRMLRPDLLERLSMTFTINGKRQKFPMILCSFLVILN